MPLVRNEFLPQSLLTVYPSASGMVDPRTGLPYQFGGLIVGNFFELTEAEAQNLSNNQCHAGRYRFVYVDSGATVSNIKTGTVGLMVKGKQPQLNVITSYDKGIPGAHPVIFIAAVSSTQLTNGAFVFVQELGIASVLGGTSITAASPNTGDLVNSVSGGLLDDPTVQEYVPTSLGIALSPPSPNTLCLVQLNLPVLQG